MRRRLIALAWVCGVVAAIYSYIIAAENRFVRRHFNAHDHELRKHYAELLLFRDVPELLHWQRGR